MIFDLFLAAMVCLSVVWVVSYVISIYLCLYLTQIEKASGVRYRVVDYLEIGFMMILLLFVAPLGCYFLMGFSKKIDNL